MYDLGVYKPVTLDLILRFTQRPGRISCRVPNTLTNRFRKNLIFHARKVLSSTFQGN